MSTPNNMTNPAVSASGEVSSLLIDKFNGKVHMAYEEGENIMSYFSMESVTGTNMVSNKYFGTTEVQVLAPGQSPKATAVGFDKNALVVDTSIIARNTVAHINDVQNDIEGVKSKMAMNQAKELKKVEDYMLIQQLIYGGMTNFKSTDAGVTGRTAPRVKGHGYSVDVRGDEAKFHTSPNYIMGGIEYAIEQQVLQDVDINDLIILMPWTSFNALRDAERITNANYTLSNGTTVDGFVLKSYNLPVKPSNRFPSADQVADTANGIHHLLSNDDNGNRYDPTDGMDKCVAIIFNTDALLVGQTVELNSDIFYEKKEKTFYIDTWLAEGAIPDRWESVSIVRSTTEAEDDTELTMRANRKAIMTTSELTTTPVTRSSRSASIDTTAFAEAVAAAVAAIVKPKALNLPE